jgi:pyruvate/2-oxoglutarate dehydrogenase complex dihydrolipoamide dehydrogenase (E3) component
MEQVNKRVQSVIGTIAHHDSPERFESLGAEVLFGSPTFTSPHEVDLDGQSLSARSIIIATGSSPRTVPIPGLEEAGFITNLDIFSLSTRPNRLIVIGAGPIGVEMSQAFTRLGTAVTLLDLAPQILPKEDADMTTFVENRLREEGADLRLSVSVKRVETEGSTKRVVIDKDGVEDVVEGDEILLSAGRQGNTSELALENAGVSVERSYIQTDSKLRSSQKHILAVGDCNGRFLFTHVAGAEGSVAVRRAALRVGGTMSYQSVPWCTYTDPELASVGYNEMRAKEAGIDYDVVSESFSAVDRAHAEGESEGVIKILIDRKGRIIGTQIAGHHAGELLLPSLFAASQNWKLRKTMSPIIPYPTMGEIHRKAASSYYAPKLFNDRVRGILRFFFRYKGSGPK